MRTGLWLVGLLVVVGLPLVGKWARSSNEPRCALDGQKIEPLYRVRVVDATDRSHLFCCVRCAEHWLARERPGAARVYVTDEAHGAEVDVRAAWFVTSTIRTNPVTHNHIHVFAEAADAAEHARAFGGEVLTGPERPLQADPMPVR